VDLRGHGKKNDAKKYVKWKEILEKIEKKNKIK